MQDVNSRTFVVRVYYRYRVFMGVCCICCEVLYLALYLQHWQPDRSAWSCMPSPPDLAGCRKFCIWAVRQLDS